MASQPSDGQEKRRERLGQVLISNRLITPEQLESALADQAKSGKRIGQILVERGHISADDLAWALSNHLGYPYVFLNPDMIDQEAVQLLPEEFLRMHQILPILRYEREITLAMADPTDQHTADEVAARTGLEIKRALALGSNIDDVLTKLYAQRTAIPANEVRPAVQHLQFHLNQALQQGASEIHFDPGSDSRARVRYRVQGVLLDRTEQPRELHRAVVMLLRELTEAGDAPVATATADEMVGGLHLHLLVTFLPTIRGASATVSFFPQTPDLPDLTSLGVPDDTLRSALLLQRGPGVVVAGCRDRRLRAALLHALAARNGTGKIWSIEIAPLYRRRDINQTVVKSQREIPMLLVGAADAGADLIVVDEVSSRRALIAAYETGRRRALLAGVPQDTTTSLLSLMLDVAGAGTLASTLQGVIAARPVRLLCPTCRQPLPDGSEGRAWTSRGCEACSFTGFRGQRLLVERWTVTPEDRTLLRGGRVNELFAHVIPQVMSQIRQQGQSLVTEGLASRAEVARVVEELPWT